MGTWTLRVPHTPELDVSSAGGSGQDLGFESLRVYGFVFRVSRGSTAGFSRVSVPSTLVPCRSPRSLQLGILELWERPTVQTLPYLPAFVVKAPINSEFGAFIMVVAGTV